MSSTESVGGQGQDPGDVPGDRGRANVPEKNSHLRYVDGMTACTLDTPGVRVHDGRGRIARDIVTARATAATESNE